MGLREEVRVAEDCRRREEVRVRGVCNVPGGEPRRASCEESPAGTRTLLLWSPGGERVQEGVFIEVDGEIETEIDIEIL